MLYNPVEYLGNPISRKGLASVDPEIRKVVKHLNSFPFVLTKASCAGYGKVGDEKRLKSLGIYEPHASYDGYYEGYVALWYMGDKRKWSRLHKLISLYADEVAFFKMNDMHIYPNEYGYYLRGRTEAELATKWKNMYDALRASSYRIGRHASSPLHDLLPQIHAPVATQVTKKIPRYMPTRAEILASRRR